MEKLTASLEKLNTTILVITLIASLLGQVWGSHKPVLNDKTRRCLHSITLAQATEYLETMEEEAPEAEKSRGIY